MQLLSRDQAGQPSVQFGDETGSILAANQHPPVPLQIQVVQRASGLAKYLGADAERGYIESVDAKPRTQVFQAEIFDTAGNDTDSDLA